MRMKREYESAHKSVFDALTSFTECVESTVHNDDYNDDENAVNKPDDEHAAATQCNSDFLVFIFTPYAIRFAL